MMKITLPLLGVSLSLLLGLMQPLPAIAGRPIFNQTPETIEKSFGRYWTKRTFYEQDRNGKSIPYVAYTYSPAGLRRAFPEFPKATLTMEYLNNRVVRASFSPAGKPETVANLFKSSKTDTPSSLVRGKAIEARFFRYLLGYNSGIHKPIHYTGGNFGEVFNTCLGDGVISSYSTDNLENQLTTREPLIHLFTLAYTTACSRPYDKIEFTQDFLGG